MVKFNKENFPNTDSLFEPSYLKEVVMFHTSYPTFARRPFTSVFINCLSNLSHLSISDSFVLVNFFLLFLHGFLIFYLSLIFKKTTIEGYKNVVIYYSSFTIFFIFFAPIYSYDEPLHYLLLLLSLMLFFQKRIFLFVIVFSFSVLVRESSLIFLIGLFMFWYLENKKERIEAKLFLFLIPIIAYAIYYYLCSNDSTNLSNEIFNRNIAINFNFQDFQFTIESLMSLFNALVFPAYLILSYAKRKMYQGINKNLIYSFLFLSILNSMLVLFGMTARESRLFAMPLLLVTPYFYMILEELKIIFSKKQTTILLTNVKGITLIVLILFISWLVSKKCYSTTINFDENHLFNEYSFVTVFLFLICLCSKYLTKFNTEISNR